MLNATNYIEKADAIILEANEFLFKLEETQVTALHHNKKSTL